NHDKQKRGGGREHVWNEKSLVNMFVLDNPKDVLEVKYLPNEFLDTVFKQQLRVKLRSFVPGVQQKKTKKAKVEQDKKQTNKQKTKKKYVTLIIGNAREKEELVKDLEDFFGRKKSINFVQWIWDTVRP
ncbi:hypothetical protein RFI_13217, partial [Reticulomyxa filosa]